MAQTKIDWLKIASAAGMHGVRYRTNRALLDFIAEVAPLARHRQQAIAEPVAEIERLREENERLVVERRSIISHATMGHTTGDNMGLNDVCVEISRQRNKLYQAGKDAALGDAS